MNNQSYRHSSSLSSSSSPPHSSSSSSVETPSNNCNNQSTTATTQSHHQPLNSINSSSDQKRRRYRIPRSCDRCRASKIKCVFENGRCSACSLSGVPCTFANPGSLKERPPTQKDVERLQARIRSLERLIHAFSPSLDLKNLPDPEKLLLSQSTTSSSSSSSSSSTSSTSSSLTQSPILSRIHQSLNLSDHQLSGSIFTTTHWSHSEPKPLSVKFAGITFNADHYIGVNSIFSLPDSAAPPSGNSCSSAELSPVDKIIRNQYQQRIFGAQHCYPEPDLEEHLLTLYFQKIHPLLPILHLPSFIQLHSSGASLTDASFRSLCLFVFAVASRFSDDPRVMLDVEGKPHQSLQVAGLRYVFSAASHLYRPIATPATLYDLQAYVLLSLYSLGAVSFMTSWSVVGIGLQRAQEAGAHREKSHSWTSNPLRDMLRRKSFFALYEFDHFLSSLVGKTAYMREEDFDLVPLDPDVDVSMGTFINPFLQSDSEAQQTVVDLSRASTAMLTTLGGFRSLLPILNSMHARSDQLGKDANLAESIKSLVNQIDSGMTRWYEQAPERLKKFSIESDSLHLVVCVFFNTNPTVTPRVANCEDTWMTFCLGLAEQMISLVNMLKSRNLLECGFFWVPSRISAATIVLICSVTREKEVSCPRLDERRKLIELSIEILKDLAPR
ncbi:fungal-specific transcription factor domain-domain-containing protein [Phakopsora pachyrhizi]|uniref:Fungal-specific transcription factor domain-domain-containing protein n=1 Tax=Phakopsora pachyrhizi TaxID=170000 RepID=A0AAV0AYL7_PHAPC|nr:fungal-specific transcription factor domain-domain-containing protein [Phakopsora pachyrhizi]